MEIDEDDCEAVLKGGELDKYLKEISCDGLFETFTIEKSNSLDKEEFSRDNNNGEIVKENLELIKLLLFSNLMLEEDASYLYSLVSSVKTTNYGIWCSKVMLPGSFLLGICSSYLAKKCCSHSFIPVVVGSTYLTYSCLRRIYCHHSQKTHLNKLLKTLNQNFYYIKKYLRKVRELASELALKEITMRFSEGDQVESISDFYYMRVNEEITFLIKELIVVMLEIIEMARRSILLFAKLMPEYMKFTTQFISLLNDDQLGLNKFSDIDNGIDIRSLDVLKNLYILIQSEYLKGIGICLSHLVSLDTNCLVFEAISKDLEISSNILSKVTFQYCCNVHPKKFNKKNKKTSHAFSGCEKVRILNSMISNLALQSDSLECYIDQKYNVNLPNDIEHIRLNLGKIEKMLSECSKFIKEFSIPYQRNKTNSSSSSTVSNDSFPLIHKNIKETGIHVGYSDFSVSDVDNVYLGITDKSDESGVECGSFDTDDTSPKLPDYVLNELKNALVIKQNEYHKRELEAVKRNNIDCNHYLKFLNSEEVETKNSKQTKCNKYLYNEDKIHSNTSCENIENKRQSPLIENISSNNAMSFQKLIAMKAVNTSLAWNNCLDEVVYDEGDNNASGDLLSDNV